MNKNLVPGLVLVLAITLSGCSGPQTANEAERMLVTARDLEEELGQLPQVIAHYADIEDRFGGTAPAQKAAERRQQLAHAQVLLERLSDVHEDSLEQFYQQVVAAAPNYLAVLKRLGTLYYNKTHIAAPSAAKSGMMAMKDATVEIWQKQDALWSTYEFRPIPSDRLWQDRLCKQSIEVVRMLIDPDFRDYAQSLEVINRGLEYASGQDVTSRAKIYAAYATFWQGKTDDFQSGIAFAREALEYEFLTDSDRARAYHVIGLCYTYLHEDSGELTDLDAAIKALNECVNIDGGMTEAKDLLKGLRIQRDRLVQKVS